jgi:hypothetical protein
MQNVRSELVAGAALGAAMLIGSGLFPPPAQAGYMVTLQQVGSNVVATGTGAIDTTGLTESFTGLAESDTNPPIANITTGATDSNAEFWTLGGNHGPTSFGPGPEVFASTASGPVAGVIQESFLRIVVPQNYTNDTSIMDTATYDSQTFTSLGVTPGTYEWTWGTGADQNFTLNIQAVPAPVIGHGLVVFLAVGGVLFGSKLLERRRATLQFG